MSAEPRTADFPVYCKHLYRLSCLCLEKMPYGLQSQSSCITLLDIPRTTTSLGDRAFAVAGPRVWNSLPHAIRDLSLSPSIFGKLLKTYLFV